MSLLASSRAADGSERGISETEALAEHGPQDSGRGPQRTTRDQNERAFDERSIVATADAPRQ